MTDKNHYKFIFLIISTSDLKNNNECKNRDSNYKMFKQFFPVYFNLFKNDVKYLFVEYGGVSMKDDFLETDEYFYIKGEEQFDKILEKTVIASDYISRNYSFDFLIRSNLSSFWNIPNLLRLHSKLSLSNFFGGVVVGSSFVSGTCIIISKDILWVLNMYKNSKWSRYDDVFISNIYHDYGLPFFDLSQLQTHNLCYQITDHLCTDINSPHHFSKNSTDKIKQDKDNILYLRIKNSTLELDLESCKFGIKTFYNIDNV